jgi:MYXO-CTERM domain-containing protein
VKKKPRLFTVLGLAFAGWATAWATPTYTVIDLGVANGWSSRATGVNDSGVVVGNIFRDQYDDGHGTFTATTAFRYTLASGLLESLRYDTPNTDGADYVAVYGDTHHHSTAAYAINNAGQIAGTVDTGWSANGAQAAGIGPYAALIAPGSTSRTIYPGRNESPYNGVGSSGALAINSTGQIAGFSVRTAGLSEAEQASILNSSGDWVNVLADRSFVHGMNDSGQLVGSRWFDAFISTGGVATSIINTLAADHRRDGLSAWDINNRGIAVGSATPDVGYSQAYRRDTDGTMHSLGSLYTDGLGGRTSEALAINDNGLIVGKAYYQGTDAPGGDYAFLYTEADGMINLTSLLSGSSFSKLTAATAISENGYIAGYGISSLDGQEHAFLLAPPTSSSVPETGATAGLMLLGLAGLAGVRRGTHGASGATVEARTSA